VREEKRNDTPIRGTRYRESGMQARAEKRILRNEEAMRSSDPTEVRETEMPAGLEKEGCSPA